VLYPRANEFHGLASRFYPLLVLRASKFSWKFLKFEC